MYPGPPWSSPGHRLVIAWPILAPDPGRLSWAPGGRYWLPLAPGIGSSIGRPGGVICAPRYMAGPPSGGGGSWYRFPGCTAGPRPRPLLFCKHPGRPSPGPIFCRFLALGYAPGAIFPRLSGALADLVGVSVGIRGRWALPGRASAARGVPGTVYSYDQRWENGYCQWPGRGLRD